MERETIPAMMGRGICSASLAAVLCCVAGFALSAPAAAKDRTLAWNPGAVVDFYATVSAVRVVPAGDPLPGLHLDANVKGRMTDIYIAPVDFVEKYGVAFSRGDEVHIVGSQTRSGEGDVVLTREITLGLYNRRTLYLRNDDGPFWLDSEPAQPIAVHRQ